MLVIKISRQYSMRLDVENEISLTVIKCACHLIPREQNECAISDVVLWMYNYDSCSQCIYNKLHYAVRINMALLSIC